MARSRQQQAEQEQAPRITRSAAANRVITELDGKSTLAELAAQADALFVEGGGTSKPRAATHCVKRALETLEVAGVVRLTRPTDIMVEKVK